MKEHSKISGHKEDEQHGHIGKTTICSSDAELLSQVETGDCR